MQYAIQEKHDEFSRELQEELQVRVLPVADKAVRRSRTPRRVLPSLLTWRAQAVSKRAVSADDQQTSHPSTPTVDPEGEDWE